MAHIEKHKLVQAIAKKVLDQIGETLSPSDSERTIADRACRMLAELGVTDTWYYDCMAYVLAGPRTCLSISGKDYVPAEDEIGPTSMVTIDLSPRLNGVWGDHARSFFIEDGTATSHPCSPEFKRGREVLTRLHGTVLLCAKPDMTFERLWSITSSQLTSMKFESLDFLGNFGHTIETELSARSYIESGNSRLLGDTPLFTFEPHIKAVNGTWGFKYEEIYYFNEDGNAWML